MSATTAVWPLFAANPFPRLHVISDLHLENGDYEIPQELEYDILVAAGDIGPLELAIPWLARQGRPVVYVLGNHERWGLDVQAAPDLAKELAHGTQVHVLERDSVVIQGVRFLGCTMWTDLRGFDLGFVGAVARGMRDYHHTTCERWLTNPGQFRKLTSLCKRHKISMPSPDEDGKLRLHPGITYLEHVAARNWLKRQLARNEAAPTVVVTHHAPSDESLLRSGIRREELAVRRWGLRDSEPVRIAAYASSRLVETVGGENALVWVHGHTHTGMDYLERSTRIVCNPRGRTRRPLTEDDLRSYALLGVKLTKEDVQRSQEAFQADPFRGDAHNFDKHLVIDFENLLQRPLELATGGLREEVRRLAGEINGLLPHLGAGESVPERCVGESIEQRLDTLEERIHDLGKDLLSQMDRYAQNAALQTIKVPAVPRLWNAFASKWRTDPRELNRLQNSLAILLAWITELPDLPRRTLVRWRGASSQARQAAAAAGYELGVQRLPAAALKRLDEREIRFVGQNEAALREDPTYALSTLLDNALNKGRIPRCWLYRVDEPVRGCRLIKPAYLSAASNCDKSPPA